MKALTLHQPWATAVALGVKAVETRGWSTQYRGAVAIHAGARRPPLVTFIGDWHVAQGATWLHGPGHDVPLPFGAVVAVAELYAVWPIRAENDPTDDGHGYVAADADGNVRLWLPAAIDGQQGWTGTAHPYTADQEAAWGDYTPGRYAWMLRQVQPIPEPVPCRGFQRLWTLPADVEPRVLRQLAAWPT